MLMTTETDLALPVRLYAMAMERAMSLAEFAHVVDATAKQMRALFIDPAAPEHTALLQRLALMLREEPASLLANNTQPSASESFASWLIRQRQDMPIATLRSTARIGAGTLLRLRSGESLPDTDQAERLNQVLGTNREEFAHIVLADMVRREGYGTPRTTPQDSPVDELLVASAQNQNGDQSSTPLAEARLLELVPEPVSTETTTLRHHKSTGRANAKSTSKRSVKGKVKKTPSGKSTKSNQDKRKTRAAVSAGLSTPTDSIDSGMSQEAEITEQTTERVAIPAQTEEISTAEVTIPAAIAQPSPTETEQTRPQPAPAVNETPAALTESEARLIKNFRALHPQAQRAVEFYIGSLIVI